MSDHVTVEVTPSAPQGAQGVTNTGNPPVVPKGKRVISVPRISESDLEGFLPFYQLKPGSQQIVRDFMNGVFISDPRADPAMITASVVEANAPPSLSVWLLRC